MEESRKKIFSLMALCLVLGTATGFYFGNKHFDGSKKIEIQNNADEDLSLVQDAGKKKLVLQKIDLLKSYTDFVLLPEEKIADPVKYADDMGEKVKIINNNEITARFYATGEAADKEQKIIDFLDYLNESIKNDLK